ncbi:ammonium transporter [uncultured Bacteroides sp.]|jgi:Amt family ammonium transporter|uniref:ammonium transporter n=1 Tax=uncultured Bacteroides sp. TaxID=162156 RepID=UPI00033E09C7|nr:ammonium transporter [uncultured Bacteroides sp.]EOS29530.1 ammonium transporter [Lachnospiraceae bacterium 28-4]
MVIEEITQLVEESVTSEVFGVWFLIGAALVFFMQAGFAMVETGFTRAKNAGNIIMKNLMDFCIGTVVFVLLGFSLMMADDYVLGIFGVPNLEILTDFGAFLKGGNAPSFVFNLVFCATAATIVSGSMAERTKFVSYCIYSGVISLFVYPIEAGWVWNSQGWLAQLGFHDFAGSAAIHSVGGITALIGAIMVGSRLGKYVKDKVGKIKKVNAIPGHSITLGALGCFILWFGWYGFNGAAAWDGNSLASIFVTTTIAPAVATCTTMVFTWIKNGKPDVSMCLNGSLAGLVGVTAGCDAVDALGSAIIGIVSGVLVVVVVEVLDLKLHIDDPVGAVGVHLANGVWGTLAVGLLANPNAPAGLEGLFYTGSFKLLGIQMLGIVAILAWTAVTMTITFLIIKKTVGLRVSNEEEIKGLDSAEHGLPSAYADFVPAVESLDYGYGNAVAVVGEVPMAEAVPVKKMPTFEDGTPKFTKVEIICKESRFETLKTAMMDIGITGMTVSHVLGCGVQKGKPEYYRGVQVEANLLPKIQVDIVVSKVPVHSVIDTAKKVLYTGHIGDGKIFVYDVENVVKVRTGEEGYDALQDVE